MSSRHVTLVKPGEAQGGRATVGGWSPARTAGMLDSVSTRLAQAWLQIPGGSPPHRWHRTPAAEAQSLGRWGCTSDQVRSQNKSLTNKLQSGYVLSSVGSKTVHRICVLLQASSLPPGPRCILPADTALASTVSAATRAQSWRLPRMHRGGEWRPECLRVPVSVLCQYPER